MMIRIYQLITMKKTLLSMNGDTARMGYKTHNEYSRGDIVKAKDQPYLGFEYQKIIKKIKKVLFY